ncbi:hypothetical protein B0H15DRAFT_152181 [Mycena belliarum]|uniref:Zn(2)-C6 fungal-type domain-containing protein n=1 Tax=Mycena belliarum TaxID=1033014 RepID=A0AAD6XKV5_9AGAR|nr:hypothetical protein B0H15DRAFT_152181 [Mycena belliae]
MEEAPAESAKKRKRMQGSCDICRKKKIRCDSSAMPGNRCSYCITQELECTHDRLNDRKTPESGLPPPKTAQELVTNIISPATVYIPPADVHGVLLEIARYARSLEEKLASLQLLTPAPNARSPSVVDDSPHTQALIREPLGTLKPNAQTELFYGKSSSVQFVKSAITHMHGTAPIIVGVQRPEFWIERPWEKLVVEAPVQVFPANDLLTSLPDIYFAQINPLVGLLHSPSFRRGVASGQHLRDADFGALVLAVCALASRLSDDPRIFLDGEGEHSAGWKWFRQVRPLRTSFTPEPSLYQLQVIALSMLYLVGADNSEESWLLAGLGLRCAQGAAGAHHRGGYAHMTPLDAELYKRVFYFFLIADTLLSTLAKGRPCAVTTLDFDVDPPADCDEQYWGFPHTTPRGAPSASAFLGAYHALVMIFVRIKRAVYPLNGRTPSAEAIAELDSALNDWVDALPEHLQWDPKQENEVFLQQSAALYSSYYHAQILIHRPFIPAPGKEAASNTRYPSLAICANAARSCGRVLDAQTRRRGLLHHLPVMTILFDCAVVLLINVWAIVGKMRTQERYARAAADVENCLRVAAPLRAAVAPGGPEGRHSRCAAQHRKVHYPRPVREAPRDSDGDAEEDARTTDPTSLRALYAENRPVAGPSRLRERSLAQQISEMEVSFQRQPDHFDLPLHTAELGGLPIYQSSDYDFGVVPEPYLDRYGTGNAGISTGEDPVSQAQLDAAFGVVGQGSDLEHIFGVRFPESYPGDYEVPPTTYTPGSASEDIERFNRSFEVPSSDTWREWSTYLANVNGLGQHPDGI